MILPEYLEAVFAGWPEGDWPSDFHIITACSPVFNFEQQERKTSLLVSQLEQMQLECFPVVGCSPDLRHQELGWGVVGLPLEKAIQIGRNYHQNAIVEVVNGEAFIVCCETTQRQSIGPFEARVVKTI